MSERVSERAYYYYCYYYAIFFVFFFFILVVVVVVVVVVVAFLLLLLLLVLLETARGGPLTPPPEVASQLASPMASPRLPIFNGPRLTVTLPQKGYAKRGSKRSLLLSDFKVT